MLQRFIVIASVTCIAGSLAACGDAIRSNPAQNTSNQLNPSPNNLSGSDNIAGSETMLQLQFPTPPSAAMKDELKREKYQLRQHSPQQSDRELKEQ